MSENTETINLPKLVIITGLSGSGLSSATNAFEDLGYFCVDNLPISILPTFARLLLPNEEEAIAIEKAALVINIRERHFLSEFPEEMKKLKDKGLDPYVVFFEASDSVLHRRFSETRRPHPADKEIGLREAILQERNAMENVRQAADLIIDTSEHTVHTLRRLIMQQFSHREEGTPLTIQVFSFGHKHGVPREVDLLFDVRHLPNPYFDKDLKNFPGSEPKVIEFLEKHDEVHETVRRFVDLLEYLLPLYKREGKSYLTIGVGCTGGRHRSVYVANKIGEKLKNDNYNVAVMHRDVIK
ncbi:MAG TPA: RNase adapter RapZ [Pyrinomonadaceae bacterium]|nr:RNase adapter RapZ [Pyrinomonadaceae bacterium]